MSRQRSKLGQHAVRRHRSRHGARSRAAWHRPGWRRAIHVPVQRAVSPRFDQRWVLYEKPSLAAGVRGMSKMAPPVGGARWALTLPSGEWKSQPTRSAEHVSCQYPVALLCRAESPAGRRVAIPCLLRGGLRPARDRLPSGRSRLASAAGAPAPRGPRPRLRPYGRPRSGTGSPRLPLAQRGSSVLSRECRHRAGVVRCGRCAPYPGP